MQTDVDDEEAACSHVPKLAFYLAIALTKRVPTAYHIITTRALFLPAPAKRSQDLALVRPTNVDRCVRTVASH